MEAAYSLPRMKSVARDYVARLPENLRVVIVDDDPYFRSLLKVMLLQAGLLDPEFFECEDSGSAVQICRSEPIELVFCDLNLPALQSKNGIDIIQDLRISNTTVPIYMVTAEGHEELIQKVRAAGATGHILKPINLRILRRILVSTFLKSLDPICWLPSPERD